ncbi:CHC2 zinc finger domain-containing protein [Novosphingobium sp. CCH12-A3]|uniref:DUF7146 domain-containing protein n=1 Tax=Novosphingobium sp. CCH12-A3 TaxID=1768752 RepID=UPI0007835C8E|nr:CHC2 zinc finger domain-containing protein [Novosphingobium sp. CCH12-A3]
MTARLDLDLIRRDNPLPIIAGSLVRLRKAGQEWIGCCPFHADRSPSFTIFDGGLRFHCFGCGASGDVLDFVQRAYRVSLPEAARMLAGGDVPKVASANICPNPEPEARTDYGKAARAIWHRSIPAARTLGEAYLRFRGILPPYPPDVRFLALPCDNLGPLPCLVLAVRDVDGEVTGIQRIFLAHDGQGKAAIETPKRSLGKVKGGAIRLGDLDGANTLTVCEGPEDGLSLLVMLGGPVWVAAGTTFLPSMQFPPGVRSVLIGADNDPAGQVAAEKAAHAFSDRGLSVRIIRPVSGAKDFNDELTGANNGNAS